MKSQLTNIPAQIFTIFFHAIKGSILGLLILSEMIGNLVISLFSLISPLKFLRKKKKTNVVKTQQTFTWFEEYFPQYRSPWKKLYLISLASLVILIPAFLFYQRHVTKVDAATMALTKSDTAVTISVANKYKVILNTGDTTDYMSMYDLAEDSSNPDKVSEISGPSLSTGSGGGTVTHQATQTGSSVSSATVSVTSNGTGTNQLYVVAVAIYSASGSPRTVSSISGGSLTWNHQKTQCAGRLGNPSIELWTAYGSPGSTFTATITLSAAPERASATVSQYSGADSTTPITGTAGSNTNGLNGACSGGTDNSSASLSLTSSIDGSVHFVATHPRHRTITTADADYTQRASVSNVSGGSSANLYIHDRTMSTAGTDSADHTLNNTADWDMVGTVIQPGSGGDTYALSYDATRTTTILEHTDTRIRIRVKGCLDTATGSSCLDDGSTDLVVTEEYTFTPEGIFVKNVTNFQSSGVSLPSSAATDGYRWLSYEADQTDAAFDDTASPAIYYGDGTTESSTTTDGVAFEDSNTYVELPGHSTGSYSSTIIGVTDWLSQTGGTDDWYWDENTTSTIDWLYTREQGTTPTGSKTMRWFILWDTKANLDSETEREAVFNDYKNPDTLSFTTGSAWQEVGSDNWNENEAAYTASMSANLVNFDIDGNTYAHSDSFYKIRNYEDVEEPGTVTLEGATQTNGTEYNAAIKPFSDADFYDSSGTSYTQLSSAGTTNETSEYLYNSGRNYTLAFESSDYLYLGLDTTFTGVNTKLYTPGSGSSPTITWQYCSANSDTATACDTWSTLTTTESIGGVSNFLTSGSMSFVQPGTWLEATVNSGPSLYYIRASLTSGSYSISPVESLIVPDILLLQHESGTINSASQTWDISSSSLLTTTETGTTGLWLIDENQTSITRDTLSDNDLTIFGASWKNTNSPAARAVHIQFDGSNDYLVAPPSSNFNFGTGSFSISGWFRHAEAISGTDVLISHHGDAGYKIYMNSSGNLCFGIDDDTSWDPDDNACSTTDYSDNLWHHFTAVKSGTTSITLYVDSYSVGTDSSLAATATLNDDSPLYFGIDSDGSSNPWAGSLDQVIFYATEKSATEIPVEELDQSTALIGESLVDTLTNGLVGYWPLDESSANTCTGGTNDSCDYSGNGNDGAWTNQATSAQGYFNKGVEFDGTTDYIAINDSVELDITNTSELTVSAWFKVDQLPSTAGHDFNIYDKWVATGNQRGYLLTITAAEDKVDFRTTTDGSSGTQKITTSDNAISAGEWIHVVGIVGPGTQKIYINGELQTDTDSPSGGINSTANLYIGSNTSSEGFDGVIDEARIYNRILSPSEVNQLYHWSPAPVGYWPFNENKGTSITADVSGNEYHGTMNGSMTESAWIPGQYGSALNFDGSNDSISVSDTNNLDAVAGASFTWEAWFKHSTQTSGQDILIAKYETVGADGGYKLLMESDGDITCAIDNENTSFPSDSATSTAATYDDNEWHHASCVKDESSSLSLYIDGNLIAQDTSITSSSIANNDTLYFGIDGDGSSNAWLGGIDEVKIYNYARTGQEINQDYNANHPTGGSPISSKTAYLRFDELSGTTANSVGTSSDSFNLVDGPSWSPSGKMNGALSFDGLNDKVESGSSDPYEYSSGGLTISLWVYQDSSDTTNSRLVSKPWNGSGEYNYQFTIVSTGVIQVDLAGATSYSTATTQTVPKDTWTHLAFTVDDTSKAVKIYKNGVKIHEATHTISSWTPNSGDLNINLVLGSLYPYGSPWAGDTSFSFGGKIDEFKLYKTALTDAQIALDMNAGSSANFGTGENQASKLADGAGNDPVGYWPLDENTGTTAYDKSGNGNDATMNGSLTSASWLPAKNGSGLDFDGSGDYIEAANDSTLDITGDITISAWIKRDLTDDYSPFVAKTDSSTTWDYDFYIVNGSNNLRFYSDATTPTTITSSGSITDTAWHHIAVTRSGSTVTFYIDGILDSTGTMSGSFNNNPDPVWIGSDGFDDFDGKMDDVKIYNYARTVAQIAYDYNRGAPVAWWRLDECTGTTIYDASDHSYNGTLTIGATGTNTSAGSCSSGTSTEAWNNGTTGRYNGSLDFDGTDDYIATTSIKYGSDITLSAWIKTSSSAQKPVISNRSGGGGETYFGISGNVTFLYVNSATPPSVSGTTGINDSAWHHLAITHTGSTTNVYVDGKLDKSTSQTGGFSSVTDTVRIAHDVANSTEYFDGQIDDVRIYNYALSADQVKGVMNLGQARFE